MKLIGMSKGSGKARLDFYGCPLSCGYCSHIGKDRKEYDLMEVLEFLADPEVDHVYIGGAEPCLQKDDLKELLQRLKRMKKRVSLKTSGFYPDLIEDTLDLVHQYVLEIKCPLDDMECNQALTGLLPERTKKYTQNLSRTLEILRGQRLRVWIRIIPGYLDEEKMDRIGREIEGIATEAWLLQFLSVRENEIPFDGIITPGPEEAEMINLARQLVKYVPHVLIKGEGFSSEFKSN